MDNWSIFLVLAEVVAFVATILKFTSSFNQSLGEFRAVIAQLKETVDKMQERSRETHKELFDKLDDHETRISHLETGGRGEKGG